MTTSGGINTVKLNSEFIHITDLDEKTLCEEWAKRQRDLRELYDINLKANQGWCGMILKIIGVNLPERNVVVLGGISSDNRPLYSER